MASGIGAAGILCLFQFAWFGWEVLKAFRTGVMRPIQRGSPQPVNRSEHPVRFAYEVLWGIVLSTGALFGGILLLYEAHHLPPGHPAQTITDYITPKGSQL